MGTCQRGATAPRVSFSAAAGWIKSPAAHHTCGAAQQGARSCERFGAWEHADALGTYSRRTRILEFEDRQAVPVVWGGPRTPCRAEHPCASLVGSADVVGGVVIFKIIISFYGRLCFFRNVGLSSFLFRTCSIYLSLSTQPIPDRWSGNLYSVSVNTHDPQLHHQ